MVARLVRDQKAAGSNPATSTAKPGCPLWVSRFCYVGGRDPDTRPVRPWGKPPRTASGGNLVGGFFNRNERSVQWTVAMIEVAARSGIPPLRLPETLIFNSFRVFRFWRNCRFFRFATCRVAAGRQGTISQVPKCRFRLFPEISGFFLIGNVILKILY